MFIKKDLRKIPLILADAAPVVEDDDENMDNNTGEEQQSKRVKREILTELKLARRKAEFKGSVRILCQPSNAPALRHLVNLSVYDCNITSLDGIGMLGSSLNNNNSICCPSLETLNIGRNPITELPEELSMLRLSLKELWCDDCQIKGPLPNCVFALSKLETLNMANNQLTEIPDDKGLLDNLSQLQRLCLDRNEISDIPSHLATALPKLEALMLRHNRLTYLPALPAGMKLLHVSSNQLTSLPPLQHCVGLEILCANGNQLESVVSMGLEDLKQLKRVNLTKNAIEYCPVSFTGHFGVPHATTGLCELEQGDISDGGGCAVYMGQNPFLEPVKEPSPAKRSAAAGMGVMAS
jgi:Leucine-rich repeat (LRR) protein